MIKSIEVTGKTEEEAISKALRELNLAREQVSVEVLERAKSGFLGIGGSPAKIRVSHEYKETKQENLESFLSGLFVHMNVEAQINTVVKEDGSMAVDLVGDNIGALIGHRGETLDAIQHLANYAVNNGSNDRVKINIDAENYRAKREEALQKLAVKVAGKVVKYRRNVTLEPMNAYERHVIHTSLQEVNGVTTYSTGTEPNRRVVVAYERTGKGGQGGYQKRSGGERRPKAQAPERKATKEEINEYITESRSQSYSREWS